MRKTASYLGLIGLLMSGGSIGASACSNFGTSDCSMQRPDRFEMYRYQQTYGPTGYVYEDDSGPVVAYGYSNLPPNVGVGVGY